MYGIFIPWLWRDKYLITVSFLSGYMDIFIRATCAAYLNHPLSRAHVTKVLDV